MFHVDNDWSMNQDCSDSFRSDRKMACFSDDNVWTQIYIVISWHETGVYVGVPFTETSQCACFWSRFHNTPFLMRSYVGSRKVWYWKQNWLCGTSRRILSLCIWVVSLLIFQCFTSTHEVAATLVSKWEAEAESSIGGDVWRVGRRSFSPMFLLMFPSWLHMD